jgi:hypothetical protein
MVICPASRKTVGLGDGQIHRSNIPVGKGMTSEEVTVNPYEKNLLELEEKLTSRDNKTKNINLVPECHISSIRDIARHRAQDAKEDELAILERFIWFSAITACFCIVTLCAYAIYPGL